MFRSEQIAAYGTSTIASAANHVNALLPAIAGKNA
jgi:hypothetical protein